MNSKLGRKNASSQQLFWLWFGLVSFVSLVITASAQQIICAILNWLILEMFYCIQRMSSGLKQKYMFIILYNLPFIIFSALFRISKCIAINNAKWYLFIPLVYNIWEGIAINCNLICIFETAYIGRGYGVRNKQVIYHTENTGTSMWAVGLWWGNLYNPEQTLRSTLVVIFSFSIYLTLGNSEPDIGYHYRHWLSKWLHAHKH